jgi:hypothetical protein
MSETLLRKSTEKGTAVRLQRYADDDYRLEFLDAAGPIWRQLSDPPLKFWSTAVQAFWAAIAKMNKEGR